MTAQIGTTAAEYWPAELVANRTTYQQIAAIRTR
jgi:hypothetical protein